MKNKSSKGVKRNPGWNAKHNETFSLYHQYLEQPHPSRWDTELSDWTGVENVKLKKKPSIRHCALAAKDPQEYGLAIPTLPFVDTGLPRWNTAVEAGGGQFATIGVRV